MRYESLTRFFSKPMKSKTYHTTTLGNIEVCKHHNSKKLAIKLKPGEIPKVIIPKLMTFEMGFKFALEKEDWILKHTLLLNKTEPIKLFDETAGYNTRFQNISIAKHPKPIIQIKKNNNEVTIYIPETEDVHATKIQDSIKNIIIEILRMEAKKHLSPRIIELAKIYDFSFNKVYIKNLKSRWGSCSAQNNINLNLHLIRLPEYLSDFIILHELCHTIHKNHGLHFHDLLNKITGGNEKPLNKELKKYSTQL